MCVHMFIKHFNKSNQRAKPKAKTNTHGIKRGNRMGGIGMEAKAF